jgi:IS30 family transposase
MRSIHERPLEIEGRTVPGHWEGDLIKGAYNRSAVARPSVGTLVERTSRYVLLAKMDGTDARSALEGFTLILRHVPRSMRQTLTYDQGKAMAKHQELAKRLQIDVYFADPRSPWQRGSNENINRRSRNGLIRQFLPKGMDLSQVSQRMLNKTHWRPTAK